MKTTLLAAFALSLTVASPALAQEGKPQKADHRNAFSDMVVENSTVKIELKDALAEATYCKFRFKVTNKTNDYVFVDPSKFKVTLGGAAMGFKEKAFMIRPYEDAVRTLNVVGGTNYHSETFAIDFADAFEQAPSKGTVVAVEEFTLPAAKNEVSGGPFTVNLLKLDQETDQTVAKYNVKYTGSALGVVDPSKVAFRIPAGQVFATAKSKSKPVVLTGGEEDNFTITAEIPGKIADMQFTTLTVLWNETFVESTKKPVNVNQATFALDAAKTAEINK
ncbi:MAG: hypothetical protein ABI599_11195 [Flavobacteriales bacterium]